VLEKQEPKQENESSSNVKQENESSVKPTTNDIKDGSSAEKRGLYSL